MDNKQLLALAEKKQEVQLRVRVISLTDKSIRVEHTPLFSGRKVGNEEEKQVIDTDEDAKVPYGLLDLRMAGIETPLSERSLKQLKHP